MRPAPTRADVEAARGMFDEVMLRILAFAAGEDVVERDSVAWKARREARRQGEVRRGVDHEQCRDDGCRCGEKRA
jgi:hypothetical protein